MRLVKGKDLTPEQRREVLAAFVYRHLDTTCKTDDEWIAKHAFRIRRDGHLATRGGAAPVYMAED